jgi:hypothetical protein
LDAVARTAQDELAAVSSPTRDKVQTELLAEPIDTNKLPHDLNRMIGDLLRLRGRSPET